MSKKISHNAAGAVSIFVTYEYDGKGNNTKYSFFDPENKLLGYYINDFDSAGNITNVKHYNDSGTLMNTYVYEY